MEWEDPKEIRKKAGLIDQPNQYLLEQIATVVA
jgi:hypothetical protein